MTGPRADGAALGDALGGLIPNLPERPTVAVAGATGFVGTAVRAALADAFRVVGLTRSATRAAQAADAAQAESDGQALGTDAPGAPAPAAPCETEWRRCDLFSLLQVERALAGADVAVYLVHSMLPSARLTQATFADLDLLLADTFARGATKAGVKQIVYLGGLLPRTTAASRTTSAAARGRARARRPRRARHGAARRARDRARRVVAPDPRLASSAGCP